MFAAQLNEYLEDLQLDLEAREMRQPYSAAPETIYQQPTASEPYQEVVASVDADQVIVSPPPTRIEGPVVNRIEPLIAAARSRVPDAPPCDRSSRIETIGLRPSTSEPPCKSCPELLTQFGCWSDWPRNGNRFLLNPAR